MGDLQPIETDPSIIEPEMDETDEDEIDDEAEAEDAPVEPEPEVTAEAEPEPENEPEPTPERFSGGSFFGGIVFAVAVMALGIGAYNSDNTRHNRFNEFYNRKKKQ